MKQILLIHLVVVIFAFDATGQRIPNKSSADEKTKQQVLKVDDERRIAYLRNDADTLDRIFAQDVTIITGGGTIDDRAETIADVRSKALTYNTLRYEDTTIRIFRDTAIVTSRAVVHGQYKGTALQYKLLVTRVYLRNGRHWLLEAIQSTRISSP